MRYAVKSHCGIQEGSNVGFVGYIWWRGKAGRRHLSIPREEARKDTLHEEQGRYKMFDNQEEA